MRLLLNVLAFQLGWLATLLGATRAALSWGGILVLAVAWSGAVPAIFYLARVIDKPMKILPFIGAGKAEPK